MDYNEKEQNTEQDFPSSDSVTPGTEENIDNSQAEEPAHDFEQEYSQEAQSVPQEEPDITTYKEHLKQMKQQYKAMKREEKRRQQKSYAETCGSRAAEPAKKGISLRDVYKRQPSPKSNTAPALALFPGRTMTSQSVSVSRFSSTNSIGDLVPFFTP